VERVLSAAAPGAAPTLKPVVYRGLEMSATVEDLAGDAGSLPPGPRLPRPAQALMRLWRNAEFSDRGHARYGDTFTVRVGSMTGVLTRDRDAIRRLFTGDPLGKRHGNDLLRTFVGEQSLLVLEPAEHLARRKMLLPPFHGERVQSYARLMERLASAELDRLRPGDVVKVQPIAQSLTLDVILQAVLGVSDPSARGRLRRIFDALNTPLNALALFVPQLTHRSRWNVLSKRPWRLKDEFDALLLEHIAATRSDGPLSERDDVLAMMASARDEHGAGLSDEQLRDELVTLITAGHQTTATAIAWGVELLVHNPAVVSKAREEGDAYLEALVKEVLRIRTPIPVGGARFVLEPFAIGTWTIPANVAVLVDAHGVHHDPAIYPRPHEFRPERFLEDPPDGYSFLPFGGGAHRCLGASLALLEIKIVLREILARLELAPISPALPRAVPRGPTLAPRGGARVRVVGRRTPAPEVVATTAAV
jgi:cytochrome P450 family 135